MRKINTTISFNIKVIGQRECEFCKQPVNIIEREGQTVSECLNCENEAMKEELSQFVKDMDRRKVELTFEKYNLIPGDLLDSSFESYLPKTDSQVAALKKCKWYANHFLELGNKHSLLLQGSYGVGKSHLSYCISKQVKELGQAVLFITMPELLNVLRDSYSNKGFSEIEILEACKNANLLVLDDLGAEYVKSDQGNESWAVDKLFQIINSRLDKPTIYTTNLSSTELKKKYGTHGGRIVSRMMNGTAFIKIEGEDHRLKGW